MLLLDREAKHNDHQSMIVVVSLFHHTMLLFLLQKTWLLYLFFTNIPLYEYLFIIKYFILIHDVSIGIFSSSASNLAETEIRKT
jgi:hypothetical protein